MQVLSILFFLALGSSVQASTLKLFCGVQETPSSCAVKAEAAIKKIGCFVDETQTNCGLSLMEDPTNPGSVISSNEPYCELISENCSNPLPGNFGGENCFDRDKLKISKSERIHNGYWFGFFGSYSTTICRAR